VDFFFHDLPQALCLQHLEREPLCHTISPGEESAKGFEDIGELCKIDLIKRGFTIHVTRTRITVFIRSGQ
jgi:hypothetical protein